MLWVAGSVSRTKRRFDAVSKKCSLYSAVEYETKASSVPPSLRTMLRSEKTVPKMSLASSADGGRGCWCLCAGCCEEAAVVSDVLPDGGAADCGSQCLL